MIGTRAVQLVRYLSTMERLPYLTRRELNEEAIRLGIADAERLFFKEEVIKAIAMRLDATA